MDEINCFLIGIIFGMLVILWILFLAYLDKRVCLRLGHERRLVTRNEECLKRSKEA